jgi:hypothetical protein
MSKILILDQSYDIWLSYTWSSNNHGICGHTFEVIDYYFILKNYFKVGILLAEDIDWEVFEKSISTKYSVTELELAELKRDTVFNNRPTLVKGKNILFTDGGVINNSSITLLFDNIFYFACGNKEIKDNEKQNVFILQDNRVYDPVKTNGIDYKKKILFSKLLPITNSDNCALVYSTKNCRQVDNYEELLDYGLDLLVITNKENIPNIDHPRIKLLTPPINNLFERFSAYIYTPTPRKWDCSPRFIAECNYYNKEVIYHNIDYYDIDLGLYWRKWDIENDFDSINLTSDDALIKILSSIIK